MAMVFKMFYLIFLLFNYSNANHNEQQKQPQIITDEPVDQQIKLGDRALLKCRVKNLKGEAQWCIDDFCLGVSKSPQQQKESMHLKGRPRYKIVGDRSKGEFDLLIDPVQIQDNMYFYCMVTAASETIRAVKSRKVFLTVFHPPQTLQIDSPVHVSLNKPSSVQCIAKQSRPPVKILISLNGKFIMDEEKYKTEVYQYSLNSDDLNEKKKLISTHSPIHSETLRESLYDTVTNVSIDDISMSMQGQKIECFAYSYANWMSHHYHGVNSLKQLVMSHNNNAQKMNDAMKNSVMSKKTTIQVDCKLRFY
jgi:hypothetical protein